MATFSTHGDARLAIEALQANRVAFVESGATPADVPGVLYIVLAAAGAPGDTTAPTAPVLSATNGADSQSVLTWTAATDAVGVTGYRVYKGGTLLTTLGNVLTYTATGLTNGTPVSFTVRALDAAGNASVDSNTQTVTPAAAASGLFSDNFNRADGPIGAAWTVSRIGTDSATNDATVLGNEMRLYAYGPDSRVGATPTGVTMDNHTITFKVKAGFSADFAVNFRTSGGTFGTKLEPSNGYAVSFTPAGQGTMVKYSGGVFQGAVGSQPNAAWAGWDNTAGASNTVVITANGSALSVKVNAGAARSFGTDSSFTSGGVTFVQAAPPGSYATGVSLVDDVVIAAV